MEGQVKPSSFFFLERTSFIKGERKEREVLTKPHVLFAGVRSDGNKLSVDVFFLSEMSKGLARRVEKTPQKMASHQRP